MSRVLKAALFCLLAWVMLAPGGFAVAKVKHCGYTFYATSQPNVHGPAVPISTNRFLVKGRFKWDCDFLGIEALGFYCMDDGPFARGAATRGASQCARDFAANGFAARPPSCIEKQSFGNNSDGNEEWAKVVEWNVAELRALQFYAQKMICLYSRGRTIQSIQISVGRSYGYSSRCNISGNWLTPLLNLPVNGDPCANTARPLPSDPTGGVGRPPGGRPLPSDPTGGLPPPPSHGITAAPDLRVDKSAGQETCLPNRSCKFKVRVSNDGLGSFKGPLTVTDTISPASERLTSFGPAPWNCTGGNGSYSCRHPGIELHPGQSTELSLAFTNTEKARGTVENCTRIDWIIPPLEGLCTAAIEEALARERETMSADAKAETDKAVKEYQCKSGIAQTGKTDAQLLRLAFKSIGMGDTNRDNDTSCAASSVDIPLPETVTLTPEQTQCTGGRFRSRSTGECLCPSNKPVWDGTSCTTRGRVDKPPATRPPPQITVSPTPSCTGGRFWDPRIKGCRCPASTPSWNGKKCYRRITKPAPSPTTPTCSGGRYWNLKSRTCLCPPQTPVWDGKRCKPWQPAITPGVTTPLCRGGMYWNKKTKSCRCPSSKPVWNKYKARCEARSLTGPPTTSPTAPSTAPPPTTTAPPTSGKIVCRGGQMVGALCWCGIGKFPKKIGKNVYQCK